MGREARVINDGDLIENENADDEIEGDECAFHIVQIMWAYGEAWLAKSSFDFYVFLHALYL